LVKLGDWSFKVDQLDEAGRLYQAARGAAALQASFALGRVAERRREWKKVIEIIGALTGEYPQAAPPYELLRTAYAALGQADKAEDARQSAAAAEWKAIPPVDDPFLDQLMDLCHSATRLLKHAGLLSRTGYAERAIQVGRRAVEADPNDAGARDFLARTLLAFSSARPELLEEALAQLTECLRIKPADPVPLGGFATEFFKSPRPRPAVERLRSLLRGRSDIPGAHFLQGQAADALGEASEAAAEYQAALKESPNNSAIYNKLGLLAESSGQTGEALAHFRKALQINPLNTDARLNLAIELVQRSMVDQGIKELQELLRQNPHDAPAHFCLGFAFLSSRRIDEAIAQFSQGLRSQPRDPEARYGLALALAAKQRREEAVREVREALRLRPEYPAAQQLLRQLGQ
jgi:tetratricopeptide (TPR) repeat protein